MDKSYLLQKLCSENKQLFFSVECLPVATKNGHFTPLIESLTQIQPLFVSIPWHLKGDLNISHLEPLIAATSIQQHGVEALLHLAATGLKKEHVMEILKLAKEAGIRNVFALRGDRREDSSSGDFPYACDLVRFIRKHFANQFTICVGGYPTGHPECVSYMDDLKYLKEKIDAGADFVITQMFFEAQEFIKFENDCRQIGINVPIVPGIMPIQSLHSVDKIINLCKVRIPQRIMTEIRSMENDEMVANYGICKTVELITEILKSGTSIRAVHFFALNRFQLSYAVKNQIEELYNNYLNVIKIKF